MFATWSTGVPRAFVCALALLLLFLEQLLDHEREVVLDMARAVHEHQRCR